MQQNIRYCHSDIEIGRELLKEAAGSPVKADRTLLWLSRIHGTHCFKGRDVFLRNSCAYHTWLYYAGQAHGHVLAYVVEITGSLNGKLTGCLYHLDYGMHCRHVREKAIPVDHIKVIYEHGEPILSAGQCISIHEDSKMGKFVYFEEHPNDSAVLGKHSAGRNRQEASVKIRQCISAYASTGEKEGYLKSLGHCAIENAESDCR